MLHFADIASQADPTVVSANDTLRRMLRTQGDDGVSARRVDFGLRRARLFAAKAPYLHARMEELGLTPLDPSQTTGAEGDAVFWIDACPHAADFDLFETLVAKVAAQCGWRSLGWSSEVREAI